ncbi:sulfurtransferase TusA family protein [Streptomyces luomodiensis]|uniref:Sulfurtransferase TusA family protein n=1 Tax=Streptomyces luomodiensis TaxID=3026192 RepID=A0ABY9V8N9_9ACTN|nr:sulfurtransferase TusA family protein [Streptomyces sp. SCA4-21]WNF01270.1 sulfurtransferase TusA family protein [Streptomyces sp. SCA4-21]
MTAVLIPAADITVDGTGLLRVTLLLRLRKQIDGAAPGTVVHVIATDPAAPLDLPAWCHMTGHACLGPVPGADPGTRSRWPSTPCPPVLTRHGTQSAPGLRHHRAHSSSS